MNDRATTRGQMTTKRKVSFPPIALKYDWWKVLVMPNEGKGYLALVTYQRLSFFESFILQQLLYQTHVIFNESSSELPSYI